jgi:hypothetical protein
MVQYCNLHYACLFLTLPLLHFRLYQGSKLTLLKLTLDFRVNYLVDPLSLVEPLVLDILSPRVQELATPLGGLIQFPFPFALSLA